MDTIWFPLFIGMVAYLATAARKIRKLEAELKAVKAELAERVAGAVSTPN